MEFGANQNLIWLMKNSREIAGPAPDTRRQAENSRTQLGRGFQGHTAQEQEGAINEPAEPLTRSRRGKLSPHVFRAAWDRGGLNE